MKLLWMLWALLLPTEALAQGWRGVYDHEGVHVEVREVSGSAIKEVRAEGVIEAPAELLFAVLGDFGGYPDFVPPTESARLLRRDGDSAYYHMVIHPPWLSRRDYCVRSTPLRLPDGRFMAKWILAEKDCPAPQKSMVRIKVNEGFWLLRPTKAGKATVVTYQGLTDPGGAVPAWLVNRATPREVPHIFGGLRRAAQSPRYAMYH